jgi:hypothetical protein
LRRLETVRSHENGWQEPYESRGSRTDLRGTGGEIPPVYPALDSMKFGFLVGILTFFPEIKSAFSNPDVFQTK